MFKKMLELIPKFLVRIFVRVARRWVPCRPQVMRTAGCRRDRTRNKFTEAILGQVLGVVFILEMAFFCSYAIGDTDPSAPPEVAPAPVSVNMSTPPDPGQAEAPKEEIVSHDGNVTLDLKEADIRNVLRLLAYKGGVNIVAGPEVTGVVTIQLTDVPWQQALDVVLSTYGYGYDQKGSIITVTTIEILKKRREDALLLAEQEPLQTKTFTLNYAKASVVIASIDKMKTSRGSVNFDERTNTLIVRDTPNNISLIAEVVAKLDTTTPQVLIEAKVIETTLNNTENLGIDWVAKATLTGSQRPHTWPFNATETSSKVPGQFPSPEDTNFTFGTINFSQLQAVLEFLKTRSDTNILSNPRIATLDNQKANIVVGSQYPIPTYTYNEEQARLQVSGWEYKDIGVIFDVVPHVNQAGFVSLEIEPKITDILDYVTVENTQLPRLSNESAKTQVMIKDGETLVIAGLIKNKTTDVKKKLPLLGDIPIIGLAFQKSEKTIVKTDLLIFLTPHIITPDTSPEK